MLAAIISVQASAVFARQLFPIFGTAGTTLIRQGVSAVFLIGLNRLWRLLFKALPWRQILIYAASIALMNFTFYLALERIPLGIAVALEFLGPLAVAVLSSKKAIDFVWVACAALGVIALLPFDKTALHVDVVGGLFAVVAGIGWAGYILVGKSLGRHMDVGSALSLSMIVSVGMIAPFGLAAAGAKFVDLTIIGPLAGAGIALALLSCALPYSFEIFALKTLPARTFSLMMSLEPAAGAMIGLMFLGERLNVWQWLGVGLIGIAAAGSSLSAPEDPHHHGPVEDVQP